MYPPAPTPGNASTSASEPTYDQRRESCFQLSLWNIIIGCLELCCFWAAYGWTIIPTGIAIFVGAMGRYHLSSMNEMRTNGCVCYPLNSLANMKWLNLCNGLMSIIGIISSVAAAISYDDSIVVRVFACFSAVFMTGLCIVGFKSYHDLDALMRFAVADAGFTANQAFGAPMAVSHTVVVQPMNGGAPAGYPGTMGPQQPVYYTGPPPLYSSQDAQQYPPPSYPAPSYPPAAYPPTSYPPPAGQQPPPPPDAYGAYPPSTYGNPSQPPPLGYATPAPAPQLHQHRPAA